MHVTTIGMLPLVLLLGSGCAPFKRWAYGDGPSRDRWQQPERVVGALAIGPGAQVVDLGAGAGYFTVRLARAVGGDGRVYAVDIDESMLDLVDRRVREAGLQNVDTIVTVPDDARLPVAGVDLVFASNVYHHLPDRLAYFRTLAFALRPGGRVAIVEHDRRGWFGRLFGHATAKETIRDELQAAGYQLVAEHGFLGRQSFLVFQRG